jgi:hypothetical protein
VFALILVETFKMKMPQTTGALQKAKILLGLSFLIGKVTLRPSMMMGLSH